MQYKIKLYYALTMQQYTLRVPCLICGKIIYINYKKEKHEEKKSE